MTTDRLLTTRVFSRVEVKSILSYANQQIGIEMQKSTSGLASANSIRAAVEQNIEQFMAAQAREKMARK